MAFGTLDLSIVTDHLIQMLRDCVSQTKLWTDEPPPEGQPEGVNPGDSVTITVTGNPPDIVQQASGCQLGVYLFHLVPNPHHRNAVTLPDAARARTLIPNMPLALDLYYVVSAFSKGSYIEEQQAMSIAVKCFYEQPCVRNVVLGNDGRPKGEFVLSTEVVHMEDMGRMWSMWQAFAVPNRLSAFYKVSVVFIEPVEPKTDPNAPPEVVAVSAAPVDRISSSPQLAAASRRVRFIGPEDVPEDPEKRDIHEYEMTPAAVAPGDSFLLYGVGLGATATLALLVPGQPDIDITSWIDAAADEKSETRLKLDVPADLALEAGSYLIRASVGGVTTNATPFCLAPEVDVPGDPPLVPFTGATLTVSGKGFLAGKTEVFVGSQALAEGAVAPGIFEVVDGSSLQFLPPAGIATGVHEVRLMVNSIAAVPAMWVNVP